ncbi:dicarboxylate/amino acid:cation symporter [Clostridium sp. CM028]|uniref:dicarboxylate/amino acid:cation symporter n=1 Tax=unclassified Clostridium TaxID=2614128 RepID=UPI001C0B4475|nr:MULTISPECIES: dicarboxylate/amino acid:cation symporter [unclassified Clostridium]MBU3093732.1 dicarboxylate/amino acid:cation symporter [Clostridium sp. CF011]MBW9146279.1 dicarboxylate/amino acid:cation symporter [Clostridium sp. CM027]MBW9149929.1 dicarboxylate/amino acid:cation symporter [Clostridium sp. CM028]UVE41824.1 dicarboxylate/amino acid:cation symporter [Clostridium sp. CM027]WAG70826.1 dicarboxylate/amino acid:cation symporter [Clostridium sp. CF011]
MKKTVKKKKIGLLPRLIIAIILGIILGKILPGTGIRIFATFNGLFGQFLGFAIPLIIIGFIVPGIGDLGSGAGKILALTAGIAYASTIIAGSIAYFANITILPMFLKPGALGANFGSSESGLAKAFIEFKILPLMDVMTALVLAFTIGIGIAAIKSTAIKSVMKEFQEIISKLISGIIIPLLPIYIMGTFANMTYAGQVESILKVFSKVFILVILLHIIVIVLQYVVAGSISGANPFRLIKKMIPAYLTAIGTQSSAATIPVTLAQTKKNGVSDGVADFVIPLCATIHLSGSTITLVSCSLAIMMLNGMNYGFGTFFGFILALGVTMVAAPGVPGGAVMASLGLLQSMLGFNETLTSLMIALYVAQDSFGTACNITGDGAIAVIINKISGHKLETPKEKDAIA